MGLKPTSTGHRAHADQGSSHNEAKSSANVLPQLWKELLLFHPIHLVPAFCPPFTVLHSDGVHKEERETPPLPTVASPLCLAVHFEMLLHMIRENLEKSLLQMKQQSLLKVRPPAVRADAHRCAWHVALTPQLLSVSCPSSS